MAKTMEEVLERFRTIEFHEDFDMIVAIANGGIVPAGIINQRLQKEVHLLRINLRDEYQHPKYDVPQLLAPVDFDFKGKNILLVDDRIKNRFHHQAGTRTAERCMQHQNLCSERYGRLRII